MHYPLNSHLPPQVDLTAKNKKKKVAQLRYQEGGEPSFWAATPKSKEKVGRGLRWFVDIDTCGVITSVGVSQKQTLGRTVMHKWKEMCLVKEIDPADVYLEPGHETIKPKLARAAAHLVALLPRSGCAPHRGSYHTGEGALYDLPRRRWWCSERSRVESEAQRGTQALCEKARPQALWALHPQVCMSDAPWSPSIHLRGQFKHLPLCLHAHPLFTFSSGPGCRYDLPALAKLQLTSRPCVRHHDIALCQHDVSLCHHGIALCHHDIALCHHGIAYAIMA